MARNEPFQFVKITPQVLTKMVDHAVSGAPLEIMGLLFGDVGTDHFEVRDCVALPVEGTETRVNASDDANEFIVKYIETEENLHYKYRAIGWYHSHPGYRCWLSAIDVATQRNHQRHQDPWLALVIDPLETIKRSKIDIGAFRTFPQAGPTNHGEPTIKIQFEMDSAEMSNEKREEMGSSSNDYYSLPIEILWPPEVQALMQRLGSVGHLEGTDDLTIVGNAVLKALKPPDHKPLLTKAVRRSVGYRGSDSVAGTAQLHETLFALHSLLASNPSAIV